MSEKDICCYVLTNASKKRSYRGYTNNITRRLRQHRGIIKGGAKYTRSFDKCILQMYISGFPSKRLAMSYEWYTKHSPYINTLNIPRYVQTFLHPLSMKKFSSLPLTIYVHAEQLAFIKKTSNTKSHAVKLIRVN